MRFLCIHSLFSSRHTSELEIGPIYARKNNNSNMTLQKLMAVNERCIISSRSNGSADNVTKNGTGWRTARDVPDDICKQ